MQHGVAHDTPSYGDTVTFARQFNVSIINDVSRRRKGNRSSSEVLTVMKIQAEVFCVVKSCRVMYGTIQKFRRSMLPSS
jgi:hypothetical protein